MSTRPDAALKDLFSRSDWNDLSTADKTERVCQAYVLAGLTLPGWETIREILGKGSASTINQARKAYLDKQARQLRAALEIPGVPEAIQQPMRALWEAAVATGKDLYQHELRELRDERDTLVESLQVNSAECREHQTALTTLKSEHSDLLHRLSEMQRTLQLSTEEKIVWQDKCTRLTEALQHEEARRQDERAALQDQINRITTAFDGLKKHAMQEIARARTEAGTSIEKAEADAARRIAYVQHRETQQEQAWKEQLAEMRQRLQASDTERQALQQRLMELHRELGVSETQRQALTDDRQRLDERNTRLEEDLATARATTQALTNQLAALNDRSNREVTGLNQPSESLNQPDAQSRQEETPK
jgi:chromosome segregation ATPase